MERLDNDDIALQPQEFGREHFRRLIKKTFDDYYPLEYNKSTFNMDDYLALVAKEELEAKFAVHLEENNENILTLRNMPWLDLGELPVSYNTNKTEAFQVYMIPQDDLPKSLVIIYSNWLASYDHIKAMRLYADSDIPQRGVSWEEVNDTLQRATELVVNYRGHLAKRNKIVKLLIGLGGLVMLIIAVTIGMLDPGNYWGPMLVAVIYLVSLLIVIVFFKYRSSYNMRMSQFLISVFCRAENNRLYLRRGIEIRPGFLGKWIEFNCVTDQ